MQPNTYQIPSAYRKKCKFYKKHKKIFILKLFAVTKKPTENQKKIYITKKKKIYTE